MNPIDSTRSQRVSSSPLIEFQVYRVSLLPDDGGRIRCGVRANGRSVADNLLDAIKTGRDVITITTTTTRKETAIRLCKIYVGSVVADGRRCAIVMGLADSAARRRFIRAVQMWNGRSVTVAAVETCVALPGDLDENDGVTASSCRIVFGPQGHVTHIIYANHLTCTETSQLAVDLILSQTGKRAAGRCCSADRSRPERTGRSRNKIAVADRNFLCGCAKSVRLGILTVE